MLPQRNTGQETGARWSRERIAARRGPLGNAGFLGRSCCFTRRLARHVFVAVLLALSGALGLAQHPPIIHIEGTTTVKTFGPKGEYQNEQQTSPFSLWISGCQWAVRLYGNTKLPNGITDVTCNGTNIYVFVPDAGGTQIIRGSTTSFSQSGSVYPGTIKVFPMEMGPIWWAYCSTCLIEGDGPIFDFMQLTVGGMERRATVNVHLVDSSKPKHRIGAVESWLLDDHWEPLAYLQPLELREKEGFTLLAGCKVIKFYPVVAPKQPPLVRCEYLITVKEFGLEPNPRPFVPAITGPALVSDYRVPNSGQYVADRWLSAKERKAVFRDPVLAGTRQVPDIRFARGLLLVLIILPLAGIAFARLLRARKIRNNMN
jgi:hypothetical protein